MTAETDYLFVGDAARLLNRPQHQVRRTADRIWPQGPRSGRVRLTRIIQELTNSEPPRGVKSLSERNLTNNTEAPDGFAE